VVGQARGPASENLQRTKPRVGTKNWFGESSYGDIAAVCGGNAMAGGFSGFDFAMRLAREVGRKRAFLLWFGAFCDFGVVMIDDFGDRTQGRTSSAASQCRPCVSLRVLCIDDGIM